MSDPQGHHDPFDPVDPLKPDEPLPTSEPFDPDDLFSDLRSESEAGESTSPHDPLHGDPHEAFASLTDEPHDARDMAGTFEALGDEPQEASLPPVAPAAAIPPRSAGVATLAPAKATPAGPYRPSPFRGILTALLAGGGLIGIGVGVGSTLPKPAPAETPPASTASPAGTTTGTSPAAKDAKPEPADSAGFASQFERVGAEVAGLARRLDDLQKSVAAMPKPEPAPAVDLKPIEEKIADLAKRVDAAGAPDLKGIEEKVQKATAEKADLAARLDAIVAQNSGFEKTLAAVNTEVATLRTKVQEPSESKPKPDPAPATGAASDGSNAGSASPEAEAEFARAVDLYKKNQFAQAKEAFAKLQGTSARDARVWYYSALTNGFTTNQWLGETERLVTRGIELEKSGSPDAAKINAAFADLGPPAAKTWLDAYRARAH